MLLPPGGRFPGKRVLIGAIANFAGGVFVGGALSALTLWVLSGVLLAIPYQWRLGALVLVGSVAIVREFGLSTFEVKSAEAMIPPTRFSKSLVRGMFVFGAELGLGFRTKISNLGPYVVACVILFMPPALTGLVALCTGWAVGRSVAMVIRLYNSMDSRTATRERELDAYDRWLVVSSGLGARLTGVASVMAALLW